MEDREVSIITKGSKILDHVQDGGHIVLVGSPRCGKTRLLRSLSGTPVSHGSIVPHESAKVISPRGESPIYKPTLGGKMKYITFKESHPILFVELPGDPTNWFDCGSKYFHQARAIFVIRSSSSHIYFEIAKALAPNIPIHYVDIDFPGRIESIVDSLI